ncbi:hypothetical protein Tco_0970923 [Tanacetum coccineum]
MAALVSCPKHNMVACLEKTERNTQFHEIVDFLTRSSIYYSLTVSPTVSTSLIEQFWNTATSKTVNDVSYIKAKVSGKTVSISEASIRRDLLFNDVDGIDCHVTPLFPNMFAQAVVDEGEGSGQPTKPQPTPSPTQRSTGDQPQGTGGSQGDHVQIPHDSPLSCGHTSNKVEGGLNLDELLVLCTILSNRVLALETSKDAQAAEILNFKTRIQKLEKKKKKLGKQDSVSKQGRKNTKSGPKLDDSTFDDLDADLAHGMDYMETEEAVNEGRQSNETEELNLDLEDKGSGEKGGSTVSTARPKVDTARPDIDIARPEVHTANAPVSTAGVTISTADPGVSTIEPRTPPTTTSIFDDEDITMAQTLIKMKEEKSKEKGVAFKDVKDSSRPIKRKNQGIDQIERDEELAHKLHEEELAEIARIQEEKAAKEEASRVAIMEMFNEVQAGIDANVLFAAKLQQEEIKEYTIEERAKFLAGIIAAQTKFRAAQTTAEIRSRPPTKSQLRNLMMTYLKNMGGYKHSQLKAKTFEEIQAMRKSFRCFKERKGGPRMKRMSKRKKTKSDLKEEEDLKTFLKIVPDKEGIIDYEVLEKTFLIINGESKFYLYDRHGAEDLVELHNLNQERWNLKSWNFYENCGVHTLTMEDGTEIHMLAERKYPLTKETLERMISLKLIAESASDFCKELASPEQTDSVSLDLSRLTTTLNRLERSIQTGINNGLSTDRIDWLKAELKVLKKYTSTVAAYLIGSVKHLLLMLGNHGVCKRNTLREEGVAQTGKETNKEDTPAMAATAIGHHVKFNYMRILIIFREYTTVPVRSPKYTVPNPTEYGVSSSLYNIAYSSQQINTAYPLPLDTAYRSSGIETKIIDFRANKFFFFTANPADIYTLVTERTSPTEPNLSITSNDIEIELNEKFTRYVDNNTSSNNEWKESKSQNQSNTAIDSFFKAYDVRNIEKESQGQTKRKDNNIDDKQPNKRRRKAEKFESIQYSIGPNEEYIAIRSYEYDIGEKRRLIVSIIYQDIFTNKD